MTHRVPTVYSAELEGIHAHLVEVETDLHVGLHSLSIVGLADKALSEAKERVSSALKNSGVKPPNKENRKIIINLAPAELKKTGSQYDLAIAIGYLLATEQMKASDYSRTLFVGELSLDGRLRPVRGVLSFALLAHRLGYSSIIVPSLNAEEAAIVRDITVFPALTLSDVIAHCEGKRALAAQPITHIESTTTSLSSLTLADVRGQENAKRAAIVAAAGGHNILMSGPPGGGKTMISQAITSLLPRLTLDEVIEATQIYSAAGLLHDHSYINTRPFRYPHHSASLVALIGGGTKPKPGEVSLAHHGILFLDELPEFPRSILEALRQPLENKEVVVARAHSNLTFPAQCMLIAAMNPCPCGYYGDEQRECSCTPHDVARYQKKISGPLLDRIDIQITLPRVEIDELRQTSPDHNETFMKNSVALVSDARERQYNRQGKLNAHLSSKECNQRILFDDGAEEFLSKLSRTSLVTARGYYKITKIAQTIADLDTAPAITQNHLSEAFGYRLRT